MSAKKAEIAARDEKAWELRMAGDTLGTIAKQLGYANASHVRVGLQRYQQGLRLTQAERKELIDLEAARLDKLTRAVWVASQQGLDPYVRDAKGNPMLDGDGAPIMTPGVNAASSLNAKIAANAHVLRLAESRRRLLGLDMPTKIEGSGPGGGPLITVTLDDVDAARAAMKKNEDPEPGSGVS